MPEQDIRKQMDVVCRELWGQARAKELAAPIAATAAALARIEAIELGSADDFDSLAGR
ncbi:MAG TPA: hypothetical protein VJT13_09315 [Xanthobacteraceae bacterium]|nr:hypothetical protein [Xanthobacteraceae bacterium]